jgi:flagellar hook-associated protein 3 FlgL
MRISTANAFDSGITNLQTRQNELSEAQTRLTSGKRVIRASDDPAAAARAERALAGVMRSETSQRTVEASRVAMTQTEGAIADAGELLQQAREALVAAGNASYGDAERKSLSDKLRGIRDQLFNVANRSDGAGSHLFAGQGATQPPFVDAAGGVQFLGVSGQTRTEPGTGGLPLTNDGAATWLSARTGNGVFETRAGAGVNGAWIDAGQVTDPSALTGSTYALQFSVNAGLTSYAVLKDGNPTAVVAAPYVSGQAITVDGMSASVSGAPASGDSFQLVPSSPTLSVFDTLDKAVADLAATGRTSAQRVQANGDNLRNIDSVMSTMSAARSLAGAAINRADNEDDRLATQKLAGQTQRSDAEDLDMVQAISSFQNQQTGYDAALKSYSMVQRISLFQYLNG